MLQNYFTIATRFLWKNKTFSLINILGLSFGMACCFVIVLYCWHEFNYDTFHKDADRLYRLEYSIQRGNALKNSRIPPAVGPHLKDYFPEIEAAARFYPRDLSIELPKTQQQFELEEVFFVDSSVVDVFHFDFLHGNPLQAFHQPDAVVISDQTAMQLFGRTDVLDQPLRLAGEDGFRVAGVVKAWPDNAHLAFKVLLPYPTMIKVEPAHARARAKDFIENDWGATHSYTYLKLKPNQDPAKVDTRLATFIKEKGSERWKGLQSLTLLPIRDIHLHAERDGPKPSGNLNYLYLLLLVGLLTLLIACINFINLSTASSLSRVKEVGVRKVLGAKRTSLIRQFLGETFFLSFFAFLFSLIITDLALPYLNNFAEVAIPSTLLLDPLIIGVFFSTFILTGFLAGLYPAFFISRFQPATILKGGNIHHQPASHNWLRKGLITIQFLAAIVFISGALILFLQTKHLSERPLGFNQELMLSLPINSGNNINALLRPGNVDFRKRMNTFDENILKNKNIKSVTQCSQLPGLGAMQRNVWTEDFPLSENITASTIAVDYDFAETFEVDLVAGRDFDASFGTDHLSSFMINEKMATLFDWETPEVAIGQEMVVAGKEGVVVGVVKDFHFQNLRSEIKPLALEVRPGAFGYFALRIEDKDIQTTLRFLEEEWKVSFPEKVFEYTFLDDHINETYKVEKRLSSIVSYFAFLAIFISCFGLFGLSALLTQQRFKEIGIRKVLGASVTNILQLVSIDFMKLIVIAILFAIPISWYFAKNWLSNFAYQIEFPWWAIGASGLLVLLIAFITVSSQSIKSALLNPVDAIRNE